MDIIAESQKYVPMIETAKDVHIPSIESLLLVFLSHLLHGDQKTATRARGAQKAKVNAVSPSRRLVGLVPVAADWHTKVKLLGVSF